MNNRGGAEGRGSIPAWAGINAASKPKDPVRNPEAASGSKQPSPPLDDQAIKNITDRLPKRANPFVDDSSDEDTKPVVTTSAPAEFAATQPKNNPFPFGQPKFIAPKEALGRGPRLKGHKITEAAKVEKTVVTPYELPRRATPFVDTSSNEDTAPVVMTAAPPDFPKTQPRNNPSPFGEKKFVAPKEAVSHGPRLKGYNITEVAKVEKTVIAPKEAPSYGTSNNGRNITEDANPTVNEKTNEAIIQPDKPIQQNPQADEPSSDAAANSLSQSTQTPTMSTSNPTPSPPDTLFLYEVTCNRIWAISTPVSTATSAPPQIRERIPISPDQLHTTVKTANQAAKTAQLDLCRPNRPRLVDWQKYLELTAALEDECKELEITEAVWNSRFLGADGQMYEIGVGKRVVVG